jgi:hypothetical protein
MFAKSIIDSDLFLDMPLSTQALYFHLAMRADDEGFVNNPKKILRMIAAEEDSLRLLIAKQFIIPFDSGIVVVKHWRIHNYIQKDRFKGTVYEAEKSQLVTNKNGEYEKSGDRTDTRCLQDVYETDTQVRLGKVSIGKDTLSAPDGASEGGDTEKNRRFIPPTVEEVKAYCESRHNGIDAEEFVAFYESKGWLIGKSKMKSWKSAITTWEKRRKNEGVSGGTSQVTNSSIGNFGKVWDELADSFDPYEEIAKMNERSDSP